MAWFHNLRTLPKLLTSFGIICIILGLVGAVGIVESGRVYDDVQDLADTNIPALRALTLTQASVLRAERDIRTATMLGGQSQQAAMLVKVRQDLEGGEKAWADYKQTTKSDAEEALVPTFEATYRAWTPVVNDALTQLQRNTTEGQAGAVDLLVQRDETLAQPMNETLDKLLAASAKSDAGDLNDAEDDYDTELAVLTGLIAAGLVLAMVIGVYVARGIAVPLVEMAASAEKLAEGDVDQTIMLERRDEVGQMASAFRRMVAYQRQMASVAEAMAANDLTQDVEPKSERDVLGNAFGQMIVGLRDAIGQVHAAATALAESSSQLGEAAGQSGAAIQQVTIAMQQIAAGAQEQAVSAQETGQNVELLRGMIDQVARGSQEQAQFVASATETATEMADGVEQVAASAQTVAAASQQTRSSAEQGAQAVDQTVQGMRDIRQVVSDAATRVEDLGRLGEQIGSVIETIDDIADQTNLLALNAAIEAARADEHGKGFAVVADEVRKLAERSQKETRSIGDLIRAVQDGTRGAVTAMHEGAQKVETGSAQASQAGVALGEIRRAVDATVDQIEQIATAAQEMSARGREVGAVMRSIAAGVEQASASTEEMAASAGGAEHSVQVISATAEESSASIEEISASAEEMSAQAEEVTAQAEEMAATAEQLQQLVARFKLEATPGRAPARDFAARRQPAPRRARAS
jgi:methyl-accepting chemotaxis protein